MLYCRPDSERYYNFTELACQLNEPEPGIAPTDSRLRPDQRLMEEGKWDEANFEKVRLEEKQRSVRREKENEAEQAASQGAFGVLKKTCIHYQSSGLLDQLLSCLLYRSKIFCRECYFCEFRQGLKKF